ncbi:MAG: thiamine phosphate synthase [Terriglobales bacterium]
MQPVYPILDVEAAAVAGHDLVACARELASLGLELQQLRAKQLPADQFLRLAQKLQAMVPKLIINDRADVALLAEAAGVHVGQDDLPLEHVRRLGPPGWLIGVSTHTLAQAAQAAVGHPDYLALGPVFPTGSKLQPDPVVGVQTLAELRRSFSGDLVAIGGIGLENCSAVWAAGANAVAVISVLWQAEQPARAAERLLQAHASCKQRGILP